MGKEKGYASFMVRLWQANEAKNSKPVVWRGEVEHIQSGRAWPVSGLDDLTALLRQLAGKNKSQNMGENYENQKEK